MKIILLIVTILFAQNIKSQFYFVNPIAKRCFVGATIAMLGNLLPEEKPEFLQLNLGYRLTEKDVISLELKTWHYFEPLGIPYGEARGSPLENFPGSIREKGIALAYQRFWYQGLYTAVHVMSA
ncbi:hypothetical protein ACFQZJ_05180 [Maribacter chungangensis]|uniref:Uncharacterized protein n=1 Tax=Maribacter chungangensis TaxID=1069117 RepID=A0ABW3B144_9FLAO